MDLSGRTINSRFKINNLVDEGRTSFVYRATDISRDNKTVALKFLKGPAISDRIEDIIRFRAAARKMSGVEHENIVAVYDVGEFLQLHYIAMEYISDKSLEAVLGNEDIAAGLGIGIVMGICRALACAHGKGVIHRDVRPGNIFVSGGGRVLLSGFGLAHVRVFNEGRGDDFITDFSYFSPEQCGVLRGDIDERSDLYSLGIIFYRLLTGSLPFEGEDVISLTHRQITGVPQSPAILNPEIDDTLSRMVLKLLEKDPGSRYQSAEGLLHDLERYAAGHGDFLLGLKDRSIRLRHRTRFIGRDEELLKLKRAYDAAMDGHGSISLISGEAGAGKTRLLEEMMDHVLCRGGLFIEGRCHEGKNKTPYGPFSDLLRSFLRNYMNYGESKKAMLAGKLKEHFRDLGRIIISLYPPMEELLDDCPALKPLEPESENKRFLMVVSRFFRELACLERGMAIVIDDLHWSDEGSLYLLEEILSDIEGNPLAVVVAFRHEGQSMQQGVRAFLDRIRKSGAPFSESHLELFKSDEISRFVSALLFESEEKIGDISRYISGRSLGNPFFAVTLLKQMIEQKVVLYDGDGWRIDPSPEKVDIPQSIMEILLERIKDLSRQEEEIIRYAAIIGKEFDLDILYLLSDLDPSNIVEAVDRAVELHIFETGVEDSGRVIFVHDRVREAFYASMGDEKRRGLHHRIAAALEERNRDNMEAVLFDCAHHYIEAGDDEKAIEFAYPAGVKARENFANEDAIGYFNTVLGMLEKTGDSGSPLLMDCKMQLAGIYVTIGSYDQAIGILLGILPMLEGSSNEPYVYLQISDAYYRKGDWKNCEDYTARGLALLGERLPMTRFRIITGILGQLWVHFMHRLMPRFFVRKKTNPRGDRYRLIASFYHSLSMSYALNDPVRLIRSVIRILNLSERYIGPSAELAMCLYAFGGICMAVPLFSLAHAYHRRGLDLNMRLNYEWGTAKSLELLGYFHEWRGDYGRAGEYFKRSIDAFTRLGDVKELAMALNGLEHVYYYTGDYENARSVNDSYYEIVNRIDDNYSIGAADIYYSQYFRETGDIERSEYHARKASSLSRETGIWFNYCSSLNELGCCSLERGDAAAAIEFCETAIRLHEENNFLKQYIVPVYNTLAQALIQSYIQLEGSMASSEKKKYMRRIGSACKRARAKTKLWPAHHGGALRVTANYWALRGKFEKARTYFTRGIGHCGNSGRRHEEGRCLYEYGLLLSQLEEQRRARENFEAAYQIFNDIGAPAYVEKLAPLLGIRTGDGSTTPAERLLDRERELSVIRFSQKISSISDFDELLDESIARAVELAGARRGAIFMMSEERKRLEITASVNFEDIGSADRLRQIIERVYKSERPAVRTERADQMTDSHGDQQSVQGRSILAVPIKSRYRMIGVCYLDNPLPGGVFTDKKVRLIADFFAQTGIAIEISMMQRQMDTSKAGEREAITPATERKIKKAIAYLEENYTSDISREGLAASLNINPDHLGKAFRVYTGEKISEYINRLRIEDAVKKLQETDMKIIDIAFSIGFESVSTFNRAFLKVMKVPPKKFRRESM